MHPTCQLNKEFIPFSFFFFFCILSFFFLPARFCCFQNKVRAPQYCWENDVKRAERSRGELDGYLVGLERSTSRPLTLTHTLSDVLCSFQKEAERCTAWRDSGMVMGNRQNCRGISFFLCCWTNVLLVLSGLHLSNSGLFW